MRVHTFRPWLILAAVGAVGCVHGQETTPLDFARAQWIGVPGVGRPVFAARRVLTLPAAPTQARVLLTADAGYVLALNGVNVGTGNDWGQPGRYDVTRLLRAGDNTLAVRVTPGDGRPALLLVLRAMMPDGTVIELDTDGAWQTVAGPEEGWARPDTDTARWPKAAVFGPYGIGPWGRLTRLSIAEGLRAMAEARLNVPLEPAGHPAASAFRATYKNPAAAPRYSSYVTVNRADGRFQVAGDSATLLFVRYSQPGLGLDRPLLRPADFDFDQFEADLELLAEHGLNLALQGFTWPELLTAEGLWLPLKRQPRGTGLPPFKYAYEVLDYALDRVQAHGLLAFALLDYSKPLPAGTLPASYLDKALLAPQLWGGLLHGQAKIARYYADRPVLAGYALAHDGLPGLPQRNEPLLAQVFRDWLKQRYGSFEALKAAWGAYAPADLDSVRVPTAEADDLPAAEFAAMLGQLELERLNAWVDALRTADPHHLLAFGDPDDEHLLRQPQRLRCDIYGTFGTRPTGLDPAEGGAPAAAAGLAAARSLRALPGSTIAAILSGRCGAASLGGRAQRAVAHEWALAAGQGAAGMITGATLDRLLNRGPSVGLAGGDRNNLVRLGELARSMSRDWLQPPARVLLVRGDSVGDTGAAVSEGKACARVAEALERAHLPYDLVPASAVGTTGEAFRVDVNQYRCVALPGLHRLPDEGFWQTLEAWANQGGKDRRLLLVGRLATNSPLSPAAVRVLGSLATNGEVAAPSPGATSLFVSEPLAGLPTGRQLYWPARQSVMPIGENVGGSLAGVVRGENPATEAGVPALVARNLASGTLLVTAGFNLGFDDIVDLPEAGYATLSYLVRSAAAGVGLSPSLAAPSNVGVFLSADGSRAAVVERGGTGADTLWTAGASRPETAWGSAVTALDESGRVSVSAPLAPYQVKLLNAVAEIHGVSAADNAVVRAGQVAGDVLMLQSQGPAGMLLRVNTRPDGQYLVSSQGSPAQTRQADNEGVAEVELPDRKPVTIQVLGFGMSPATVAQDPLALAEYYLSRRDIDAALREFDRLALAGSDSPVAKAALKRREEVLRKCGVVVMVNESVEPILANYVGPPVCGGPVDPGRERRFILLAGTYQFNVTRLVDGKPVEEKAATLTLGERGVLLQEWPAEKAEAAVLERRVRAALGDDERKQLMASALALLPGEPVPAPAAGPGGTGAAGGPGGETPGGAVGGGDQATEGIRNMVVWFDDKPIRSSNSPHTTVRLTNKLRKDTIEVKLRQQSRNAGLFVTDTIVLRPGQTRISTKLEPGGAEFSCDVFLASTHEKILNLKVPQGGLQGNGSTYVASVKMMTAEDRKILAAANKD